MPDKFYIVNIRIVSEKGRYRLNEEDRTPELLPFTVAAALGRGMRISEISVRRQTALPLAEPPTDGFQSNAAMMRE